MTRVAQPNRGAACAGNESVQIVTCARSIWANTSSKDIEVPSAGRATSKVTPGAVRALVERTRECANAWVWALVPGSTTTSTGRARRPWSRALRRRLQYTAEGSYLDVNALT